MNQLKSGGIPRVVKVCAVITGLALHAGIYYSVVPKAEAERAAVHRSAQQTHGVITR
jgi:hypothetical protein